MDKRNKSLRMLEIYSRLMDGQYLKKGELANEFGVDGKSIQRDIEDIRSFLNNNILEDYGCRDLVYDWAEKGYYLESVHCEKLTNCEILAICKILLESRAFTKREMMEMLDKLVMCCVPETNRETVEKLIQNEAYHYIEPRHGTVFIDKMWDIGQAIQNQLYIEIEYQRNKEHKKVRRKLKPVAIMFSEFYFYLTAFIEDEHVKQDFDNLNDSFPTIYRIDRISELNVLDEHFGVIYKDRFQEGEFRKRVQFMYGGKLQKIRFRYSGLNVESVLDRLPTAKILSEDNGVFTISAEVFGDGIDMWIRSQGDCIEMINEENGCA